MYSVVHMRVLIVSLHTNRRVNNTTCGLKYLRNIKELLWYSEKRVLCGVLVFTNRRVKILLRGFKYLRSIKEPL